MKSTLHWVSAAHSLPAEARLYDHLFSREHPDEVEEGHDWKENLNPRSLEVVTARVEPSLGAAAPGSRFQFERLGYFCADPVDWKPGNLVFNRTVTLKDAWVKAQKKKG